MPPETNTDTNGSGPETVGQRLRRLRTGKRLSHRDLSSPGVSYAYISRIEAGTRQPSVKALRKLAAKLDVTADYLETGATTPVDEGLADAARECARTVGLTIVAERRAERKAALEAALEAELDALEREPTVEGHRVEAVH